MTESAQSQPKFSSFADPDLSKDGKTLYEVSYRQLVWRNFVAGMSRALGMVFIQFLFFVVIAGLVAQFLLPQLETLIGPYFATMQNLQSGNSQLNSNLDSLMELIPTQ